MQCSSRSRRSVPDWKWYVRTAGGRRTPTISTGPEAAPHPPAAPAPMLHPPLAQDIARPSIDSRRKLASACTLPRPGQEETGGSSEPTPEDHSDYRRRGGVGQAAQLDCGLGAIYTPSINRLVCSNL